MIELAKIVVSGEDGNPSVTRSPWREVTLAQARELLQIDEYDIRVDDKRVALWSLKGRIFRE